MASEKTQKTAAVLEEYAAENISPDTSFLEMLDILNNNLIHEGKDPVVFDHDCREGICGMCSLFIDGRAHGPDDDITTCQLHACVNSGRRHHHHRTVAFGRFPVIKTSP